MEKDWQILGNIIPGVIIVLLLGLITYYLIHSFKVNGTICTSCSSCHIVKSCNKDDDIRSFYENIKSSNK